MAPKKKIVKKKAAKPARKGGGGKAGVVALSLVLLLVIGLVAVVMMMRPKPIKPINADVVATFGEKGDKLGQLDGPRGLAIGGNGTLYIADLGNHRVARFTAAGEPLEPWGKKGDKPGQFNEPSGVAVDTQGRIWVADPWNGRIQGLDDKGKMVAEIAGRDHSFYSPRNVASDRMGNIYVADTGNSCLKAFDANGARLKVLGERGKGKGRFDEIFGIAVNGKGEIFAADPGGGRIQKFSPLPEPKPVAEVKVPGWQGRPFWPHLAVDSKDRIYAVDGANRRIWVYNSQLEYIGTLGATPGRELFANPLGIAIGADDSLYVTDMGRNAVLKVANLQFPAK